MGNRDGRGSLEGLEQLRHRDICDWCSNSFSRGPSFLWILSRWHPFFERLTRLLCFSNLLSTVVPFCFLVYYLLISPLHGFVQPSISGHSCFSFTYFIKGAKVTLTVWTSPSFQSAPSSCHRPLCIVDFTAHEQKVSHKTISRGLMTWPVWISFYKELCPVACLCCLCVLLYSKCISTTGCLYRLLSVTFPGSCLPVSRSPRCSGSSYRKVKTLCTWDGSSVTKLYPLICSVSQHTDPDSGLTSFHIVWFSSVWHLLETT